MRGGGEFDIGKYLNMYVSELVSQKLALLQKIKSGWTFAQNKQLTLKQRLTFKNILTKDKESY